MNILPRIRSALSSWKQHVSKAGVKKLLASRAFLVTGCVLLIAVSVGVSALLGRTAPTPEEEDEAGKILGNTVLVGETVSDVMTSSEPEAGDVLQEEPKDLLAITVLNRTTVREEAISVLQKIAANPDSLPDEKEQALAQIASIMRDMEAESNIETLSLAKGIPECVAVISGKSCSVIVDAETLSEEECARIVEIVYEQSGILPSGIKVIPARPRSVTE